MAETVDYADAPGPTDAQLRTCVELALSVPGLEERVISAARALRDAVAELRDVTDRRLPDAMTEAGHGSDFKLGDGRRVSISHRYVAGKLTDDAALDAIVGRGDGDIVSATIFVELPAEQLSVAQRLFDALKRWPAANSFRKLTMERSVHPSRVGAYVKELVERRGEVVDLDLFGVVDRRRAKVAGGPRVPTVEIRGLDPEEGEEC